MECATEQWRKPTLDEGDVELCSEHGRIANKVDFRSHWLVLVKADIGGYYILVKHGAGEERISLGYRHHNTWIDCLPSLDSDQRYLLLYTIYKVHGEAAKGARDMTANKYQVAFIQGRLKKRKRNHCYRVEILPEVEQGG